MYGKVYDGIKHLILIKTYFKLGLLIDIIHKQYPF